VTAACSAAAGHQVSAWDPDPDVVRNLAAGEPPVKEPGLADLVRSGLESRRLALVADLATAVRNAEIVWITFDTPVDQDDRADVDWVVNHAASAFRYMRDDALMLVSSQLPVGSSRRLEDIYLAAYPGGRISVACSPENLRSAKDRSVHEARPRWSARSAETRG
jgi:UDPglucose 6-dehydrogenase